MQITCDRPPQKAVTSYHDTKYGINPINRKYQRTRQDHPFKTSHRFLEHTLDTMRLTQPGDEIAPLL
ncbi:hypothetical protein BH10CYA1_BH10CYA1_39310 [soil metagenome]